MTQQPPTPAPDPTPTPTPTPAPDPAPTDQLDPSASARDRQRFSELTSRLQERETERDQARQRLEAAQWREALALAGGVLAQPDDLRLQAPDLAALLGDDGNVDAAKVQAAAAALVAARPGMKRPTPPGPLPGGGQAPPPGVKPPTLADVFNRAARGRG